MEQKIGSGSQMIGATSTGKGVSDGITIIGSWKIEARDPNGNLKWIEEWENLVVGEGLAALLDYTLLATSNAALAWYVGLTDGTPTPANADTMSSHAGWTEVTAYDEAVRQTWTGGSITGTTTKSVSNSASPAVFTIDTNSTTVGGAFLVSNSTKGGSTGTLFAAGAFTAGDKSLDDNDTITVTATFTQTAS
jgi:hypothetical protein